jgi:adenylate kinase family enzyme
MLSDEFGLISLSIGNILRESRLENNDEGKRLDKFMKEFEETGKLMPMEEIAFFLEKAIYKPGWENKIFLIDGLIKAKGGLDYWNLVLSKKLKNKFVLFLECSKEEMLKRMDSRSKTSGRLDDNENIFDKRVKTFFDMTYPCIRKLALTETIVEIDTERVQSFVYEEIRKVFIRNFPDLNK